MIPLTLSAAKLIAHNMRERDRREIRATSFDWNPDVWSELLIGVPDKEFVSWQGDDGTPVAMGGVHLVSDHAASSWFVATDRIGERSVAIHKGMMDIHRRWQEAGVRRFFAHAHDAHRDAQRWMTRLGYVREGVHPFAGTNGETLETWAWVEGLCSAPWEIDRCVTLSR